MDLLSYSRWDDYSRARDAMFAATDTAWAPWHVADTDDKTRGPAEHHHATCWRRSRTRRPDSPPVELPEAATAGRRGRASAALDPDAVLMPADRRVERWVPGVRAARTLRPIVAAFGRRRRRRARGDPGPAGHGVRRARRAAGGHRPLHDDRLPRRLRAVRALARAGARTRLVDLAADLRRDHAAARRRRGSRNGDRARRDARRSSSGSSRSGSGSGSSGSSPTCSPRRCRSAT